MPSKPHSQQAAQHAATKIQAAQHAATKIQAAQHAATKIQAAQHAAAAALAATVQSPSRRPAYVPQDIIMLLIDSVLPA